MATYFIQNTNSVEDIEQMNNVIDKVNKVNTEATSNIGQLTDLNNKAQELSNNIQQALPINTELKENIKIGQPLVQEATSKNTELQASLEKTKEFINGLDGSQNIPQIRMDVTELQNGLKSNQALAYQGSSINAENTLEGRTERMFVKGRTLQNLVISGDQKGVINKSINSNSRIHNRNIAYNLIPGKTYVGYINVTKYEGDIPSGLRIYGKVTGSTSTIANKVGWNRFTWSIPISVTSEIVGISIYIESSDFDNGGIVEFDSLMLFEEGSKTDNLTKYFEGIKSFGEAEGNKISILSNGKNLVDLKNVLDSEKINYTILEGAYFFTTDVKLFNNGVFKPKNASQFALSCKIKLGTCTNARYDIVYEDGTIKSSNFATSNLGFSDISVISDISKKVSYIRMNWSSAGTLYLKDLQIEEGSQVTNYKLHKQDKKDILIKEPLRGFDENTCDIMYEDNGQVKVGRKLSEYTFTGDENWQPSSELQDELICFYISFPLTTVTTPILCNNFIQKPTMEKGIECITNNGGGNSTVRIKINKSKLTTPDINGFKTWLKANPTTIVYQLATPTVEVVENCVDIDLDTFGEKTYFNILNSLPGSLDFKVPSNIASIVQNTAREVNNIWDVINNLLVPSLIDINKNVAMATIKNNLK